MIYCVSLLPDQAPVFESGNVDSGESWLKEGERRRSYSRNLPPRWRKGSVNRQWRVKSFMSQQWRVKKYKKEGKDDLLFHSKMPFRHHLFPAKFGNKYGQLLLYHLLEFSIHCQTRFFRYKNASTIMFTIPWTSRGFVCKDEQIDSVLFGRTGATAFKTY